MRLVRFGQLHDGCVQQSLRVGRSRPSFTLLIILERLTKKVLAGHSTDFFINIVVALAASPLGVAFFFRTRHDESALDDDFQGQHRSMKLENRIRVCRAEHRLNQAELADIIGVSRKTISTIEVGR